jgi:hypothetical protein
VLDAVDIEVGNYHIAVVQRGLQEEMEGGGRRVAESARRAASYLLRQARWAEASTMLERMLQRDRSPESLAFALPLLRRITEATAGTERGLLDAGILAKALSNAGRTGEAELMMRDVIARSTAQGDYRVASISAGDLVNLLRSRGRLTEALTVLEEKAGYTLQTGLGPWTQLGDETYRLQMLNSMGRYDEVLTAVEALRPRLEALPLAGEAEEAVEPWNVRETLLDAGSEAALHNERWEAALAFSAEIVKVKQERGAGELEMARTRYNEYGPLLRLGRYAEAHALLRDCRAVFETARHIEMLGRVYSALASLEDKTGSGTAAVRFEEVALGYRYQDGEPDSCALSHHNLANYLERQGTDPATVLAHSLAAATICLQTQSGRLLSAVRTLATAALPPTPPAFAAVANRVEAVAGVRFRALFDSLPRTAPDGDAALAVVWQLVQEEQRRQEAEQQRQTAVLAALPAAIRAAFDLEGDAFSAALQAALAELPAEDAAAIQQRLHDADLITSPAGPDLEQVLREFEPLLQAIVAATTDASQRGALEPVLADLEQQGWKLQQPVQRLWAG